MSPFGWVSERARPRVLAALAALLVVSSLWLWLEGRVLETPAAPLGIVSYELAGSAERAAAILASWPPRARAAALRIQGVDSVYLLVYPATLSLAVLLLGFRLGGRWRRAGLALSWLVLLAAPLDAVENHALVRQLVHGPTERDARLARASAVPKFALVALGSGFLLVAGAAALLAPRRRDGDRASSDGGPDADA